MEEVLFEVHQLKNLLVKQEGKFNALKSRVNEQKANLHSIQQHFNTYRTCLEVYIDTMKQLKSEYKIVLNKVQELDKNYQNAVTLLEQRSPDVVMGTCFQEMHRLEMQKIKTLELKIQELEDNIARFNSPSELNTHFNFTLDNNALRYSPNSSVQTVITPMSPFIL